MIATMPIIIPPTTNLLDCFIMNIVYRRFVIPQREQIPLQMVVYYSYYYFNYKTMIKGNFLGAAIVAILYTVYILMNPNAVPSKTVLVIALVILNALTIVLMSLAFK